MSVATTRSPVTPRRALGALSWVTVLALLGLVACNVWLLAMLGYVIWPRAINGIIMLIAGGMTLTGLRWAPLLAAILMLSFQALHWAFAGSVDLYQLTHPAETAPFLNTFLQYVLVFLGVIAGVGATVQNYRNEDRGTPCWLSPLVACLAGTVLGAAITGGLTAPEEVNSQSATNASGMVEVNLGPADFRPSQVTVPQGGTLRLVNHARIPHVIANGTWEGKARETRRRARRAPGRQPHDEGRTACYRSVQRRGDL